MIDLTKRYIDSLGARETIMIPSVVLAEYLQGFKEDKERRQQLSILRNRFFIPAFDVHAAALAAEIATSAAAIIAGEEKQRGRKTVKADIQIIATAINQGADAIITSNVREFERLAASRIKITEVPETHIQAPLSLVPPP
jgi:predicted nucleic acid-binding protein